MKPRTDQMSDSWQDWVLKVEKGGKERNENQRLKDQKQSRYA